MSQSTIQLKNVIFECEIEKYSRVDPVPQFWQVPKGPVYREKKTLAESIAETAISAVYIRWSVLFVLL